MHPIDIAPKEQRENQRMPGGGSGFWAVAALVAIVALVIVLAMAFSGDGDAGQQPNQPPPAEAPVDPGL